RIEASQGVLVADWQAGENAVERLFVLAGMEGIIGAMAHAETRTNPIELPAVFLGGNHEDGELGVSVRLSPLVEGRVLLLLRPLEAAGVVDQTSVQQHNDLALLRGQMERSKSQAELNLAARERLFDTLRWGFRAPLCTVVQALHGQDELESLAQGALKSVDDWLQLLALKSKIDAEEVPLSEPIAVRSLMARLKSSFEVEIKVPESEIDAVKGRLFGSAEALETAISGLLRAAYGDLVLAFSVENSRAVWRLSGIKNIGALLEDYRLELARSAALFLDGAVTVKDEIVELALPLKP
ncbi:MAG: hypothetical protein ACPG40_01125, partial [Alphaproteobacteria bacterium]